MSHYKYTLVFPREWLARDMPQEDAAKPFIQRGIECIQNIHRRENYPLGIPMTNMDVHGCCIEESSSKSALVFSVTTRSSWWQWLWRLFWRPTRKVANAPKLCRLFDEEEVVKSTNEEDFS